MNFKILVRTHTSTHSFTHSLTHSLVDNNQFQLLVELAKPEDDEKIKRTIYVVGDPYQTIYSWRGANPLNMELFAMKYPQCKTFVLKNNYRSNYKIVSAARHLMQNTSTISSLLKNKGNIYRITADSEAVGNSTSSSVHNDAVSIVNAWHDKSQAEYVAHMIDYYITNNLINGNEIAVMYRTHSQSIPLQTALLSRQIKYIIIGDISLMNRKEIKDALAYLRLLTNNDDSNALKRIINYPPRGIGESLQSRLFPTDGSGDSNGNLLSLLVYLGNNEINKNVTDAIDPLENESVTEKDIPKLVLQDLTTRQLKSLTKASETFYELDKLLHHYEGTMEELVVQIFQKSGLTEYIREKNSKDSKVAPRLNHLDQLIYLARIYDIEISNQDPEEFFAG
jgi:DNA helicase-2/ATP-dependent DNA helicase PcrA